MRRAIWGGNMSGLRWQRRHADARISWFLLRAGSMGERKLLGGEPKRETAEPPALRTNMRRYFKNPKVNRQNNDAEVQTIAFRARKIRSKAEGLLENRCGASRDLNEIQYHTSFLWPIQSSPLRSSPLKHHRNLVFIHHPPLPRKF